MSKSSCVPVLALDGPASGSKKSSSKSLKDALSSPMSSPPDIDSSMARRRSWSVSCSSGPSSESEPSSPFGEGVEDCPDFCCKARRRRSTAKARSSRARLLYVSYQLHIKENYISTTSPSSLLSKPRAGLLLVFVFDVFVKSSAAALERVLGCDSRTRLTLLCGLGAGMVRRSNLPPPSTTAQGGGTSFRMSATTL